MEIFGLSAITIVLLICLAGVALRVYVGIVENPGTVINVNVIILSFVVGIIVSVSLVAPVIDAMPDNTAEIVILPLIAGQIIVVMKSETIATSVSNMVRNTRKKI